MEGPVVIVYRNINKYNRPSPSIVRLTWKAQLLLFIGILASHC